MFRRRRRWPSSRISPNCGRARGRGSLLLRSKRPDRLDRALEAFRDAGNADIDDPDLKSAQRARLSGVLRLQGKPEEALAALREAIGIREAIRGGTRIEEFRTSLASRSRDLYEQAIALSLDKGDDKEAFELSERARARTFLDQLGYRPLAPRKGLSPELAQEDQRRTSELAELERNVTQAKLTGNPAEAAKFVAQLSAAREQYLDFLRQLKISNPQLGLVRPTPLPGLAAIQKELGPQTTLVSFFFAPGRQTAFVVTQTSCRAVPLHFDQAELELNIRTFRDFASVSQPGKRARSIT